MVIRWKPFKIPRVLAGSEDFYKGLSDTLTRTNGQKRPAVSGENYYVKKIKGNTVTVTFKNVKSGTYYIGLHAWNRTSEDNSKTFSEWSNVRKVKMK